MNLFTKRRIRPPQARFYVLDCDICGKTLGWTTDGAFPERGLTRCGDCMKAAIMEVVK